MKLFQPLLASSLLVQSFSSSSAFQAPFLSKRAHLLPSIKIKPAVQNVLQSKQLGRLNIQQKLFKKPLFASKHKKKSIDKNKATNKQILALVTTCCLTCLLRPTVARASISALDITTAFIDPMAMTDDEVPGLGMLSIDGAYNLGFVDKLLRRKSLAIIASALLIIVSFVRSTVDGCTYWTTFVDKCRALGQSDKKTSSSAKHSITDVMTVKDAKQLNQAKHVDWDEYSHNLFGLETRKKMQVGQEPGKHTNESKISSNDTSNAMQKVLCSSDLQLIMLLAANTKENEAEQQAREEFKLHQAHEYFQEQKDKLHHHQEEQEEEWGYYTPKSSMVPSKRCTWDQYKHQLEVAHEKDVEDTKVGDRLHIMKNMLTWDDYKQLVGQLQDRKNEVNELKQEVKHLNSLLKIEQSIHQAITYHQVSHPSEEGQVVDELKELDKKSAMYDETVKDSLASEENHWYQVQGDLGSGIK